VAEKLCPAADHTQLKSEKRFAMNYKILVLVKQVPDTKAISSKAMNPDGTLNRGALSAVFNPEDLNALEAGLQLKERYGGRVTVITMGPPAAAAVLREALYRGADEAILLTDRHFAASDTLATSYILSRAISKAGHQDIILCGRQAIDGNTAQVGPQVAEKLGLPQISAVEEIVSVVSGKISAWRMVENGRELLEAVLPAVLTVVDSANEPRPQAAKKIMRFKKAKAPCEATPEEAQALQARGLLITEWNAEQISADLSRCGIPGSPTKVQKIKKVVLKAHDFKQYAATDESLSQLLHELTQEHTFD
jgi:electron transfer flavoprotein beta subunit